MCDRDFLDTRHSRIGTLLRRRYQALIFAAWYHRLIYDTQQP
jgi:predicted metal-dependent HD superfamily phosphohydrolase